ncbi:LT_IagB_like domain containing protein [Paracoccaceae bacterium]|jgi:hypothetical protein
MSLARASILTLATFPSAMILGSLTPLSAVFSSTGEGALCEAAAAEAADLLGVPYEVLIAVSVVETGRNNRPWPWTVNIEGESYWTDTASDAEAMVRNALDAGLTNIDLGCFQLNYRWHAAAFASIADMLDPASNTVYAAGYLLAQYDETGDWPAAAAAYHSATPEYAERYLAKFEATRSALAGDRTDPLQETRLNRYPLLVAGQSGGRGSLVPATAAGIRLIGEP